MPLTARQTLMAAQVPGRSRRVYCIGSFARRVNFLAQQRRALNLIWALHETKRLEPGMRVAVIGGGLAGVTAAGALIAYGAKVDLFEKGARVLHRQRMTKHRRVHPTINAWPFEPICVTTDLPFYDWATGFCNEVADEIAKHFEKAMDERNFEIHTEITARDISPIGTSLVRIVTSPALKNIEGYDFAIITVGFGDEIEHKKFESKTYWANDNLEMDRDSDDHFQNFVVSGCGDGGLIDALRIVHLDFGEGQLAFNIASRLCGTPIAAQIHKAELKAAAGAKELAADTLAKAYKKIAKEIASDAKYADVHSTLLKSMQKFNRILYIGDMAFNAPFSTKSAPIHKLMIAHVMETTGQIKYQPFEVTQGATSDIQLGQYKFDLDDTKVVIRHGAKPEFKNLIGEDDYKVLKARQEKLNDRCAEQSWPVTYTYPTPPGWTTDRSSKAYTRVRREMAKRAFELIIPEASVVDRPGKFCVELDAPPPANAPHTMFNVPVEYIIETESDAL